MPESFGQKFPISVRSRIRSSFLFFAPTLTHSSCSHFSYTVGQFEPGDFLELRVIIKDINSLLQGKFL